jgi:MFS family permease
MRRLLSDRDARLYLSGQILSSIGDSSLWLAMGIWIKILTGSNSDAGLAFFAFSSGIVLAPLCGVVVDRLPRRPLLAAANLAGAALVSLLLLVHGAGEIWLIYGVMFCYGALNSLISSAQTALMAVMIPDDLLGDANTLLQIGSQGTRIFTPLIGAGLLAWIGPQPVVLLDVATFLAATATAFSLRLREQPAPAASDWKAEFTAGLRYIGRTPPLRRLLVTFVIALTVFGFMETIAFAVVGQGLHRTPPFLGVLIAVMAAGSIAGAVVVSPVMRRTSERTMIAAGLLACVASCLLLTTGLLPVALAGCALLGASLIWINVAAITLIQRRTPAALLGRVEAALNLGITIPQALSIAVGAALIAAVSYRVLLIVMAAVTAAAVMYLVSRPDVDVPEVVTEADSDVEPGSEPLPRAGLPA